MMKAKYGIVATVLLLGLGVGLALSQDTKPSINPAHQSCNIDSDCRIVRTRCEPCCPTLDDSVSINAQYINLYKDLGQCTPAHMRSCGVPECGLESTTPMPVCRAGRCEVIMGTYH